MSTPSATPTEEQIAHRAREIWNSRGRPSGHDTEIWLEAERLLRTTAAAHNAPSATSGRGNGNSQNSKSPADPKPADLKKPAPSATAPAGKVKAPGGNAASSSTKDANTGAKPAPAASNGAAASGKNARPGSKSTPPAAAAKGVKPGAKAAGGETERLRGEMASESEVEFQITPAVPDDEAIMAALQKKEARAPQTPTKSAPHTKPPETGKPLWSKPHSS